MILRFCVSNTDKPIVSCPETNNGLRANITTSRNKIKEHRLENLKSLVLRYLNVNSLRYKIEAVEELM